MLQVSEYAIRMKKVVRGETGKQFIKGLFQLSKEFLFYPEINKENFSKEPKYQIPILEHSLCLNYREGTEETGWRAVRGSCSNSAKTYGKYWLHLCWLRETWASTYPSPSQLLKEKQVLGKEKDGTWSSLDQSRDSILFIIFFGPCY